MTDDPFRDGQAGLAFLADVLAGRRADMALDRTLGVRLTAAEPGLARLEGRPTEAHLNHQGGIHGGWYAAILDSAMGYATVSTLAPDEAFTTLEFKLNLLRPLRPGAVIRAEGRLPHRGRSTALGEATLTDEDGRTVARATGTNLILRR